MEPKVYDDDDGDETDTWKLQMILNIFYWISFSFQWFVHCKKYAKFCESWKLVECSKGTFPLCLQ